MDSLWGYFGKSSKIDTSVMDQADNVLNPKPDQDAAEPVGVPHDEDTKDKNFSNDSDSVSPTSENEIKHSGKGMFDWLPNFQSSAEHYLNSLLNFGVTPVIDNPAEQTAPQVITKEPVDDFRSVSEANPESVSIKEADASRNSLPNWLTSVSNRSEEVWQHIKQDFGEMISTASKEPKEMAATIYQRISAAAIEASNKIDISKFHLLPDGEGGKISDDVLDTADLPSLIDLRDDVKKVVNDFVSNLFGSDTPRAVSGHDRREARLQIIRADPVTYELEPPLPPANLNVYNYSDWRAAYFDETTCQPLPGIPLFPHGSGELVQAINRDEAKDVLIMEPQHPSPEKLLDAHPFMRGYLTQLVGDFAGGITDGDFWSRYYYRVWLMDVTEARRQLLTARLAAKQAVDGANPLGSTSPAFVDWLDESDEEQAGASGNTQPTPAASVEPALGEVDTVCPSSNKAQVHPVEQTLEGQSSGGTKQRRRSRKASELSERKQSTCTSLVADSRAVASSDLAALSVDETASRPQQQTCESDGSSSIVVLGNGDEEALASPPGRGTCRQYTTEAVVHSSAEPSDEWSDVVDEEPTTPGVECPEKPTELKVDQDKSEADEWEEWS